MRWFFDIVASLGLDFSSVYRIRVKKWSMEKRAIVKDIDPAQNTETG